MKRFWLVMLSLGLVLAFSASAMAVDVKFSGSFYAAGMYLDKTKLTKYASTEASAQSDNISTAFYYQRLRVQTDFIVSPGLKLVTRFDAMERAWGAPRASSNNQGTGTPAFVTSAMDIGSVNTTAENENISWELAYIDYTSPIGLIQAGYMTDGKYGTVFGDNENEVGKIQWTLPVGPVVINASVAKWKDRSYTVKNTGRIMDADDDKYTATVTYLINKDSRVGLLYQYQRLAEDRGTAGTFGVTALAGINVINPYAMVKIGPVSVEAEVTYANGEVKWEDGGLGPYGSGNLKIDNLSAYLNAVGDFGMFYAGGTIAYVSGDDPSTTNKLEGGLVNGGLDYRPTLLMFNGERQYWVGGINGFNNATNVGQMGNVIFGQIKAGVRPTAALDINASVAYATADKKPYVTTGNASTIYLKGDYGWEFDVTGTYKITNNLSYMLGAGYWLTGDYFRASVDTNQIQNNFILINKLTLTF